MFAVIILHYLFRNNKKKRSREVELHKCDRDLLSQPKITQIGDCCACCGIAADDNIKLKTCDACKLARYCSVECQRKHRPKHKKACKKRAAELRDDELFSQPESTHLGECPICFLPLPTDPQKSTFHTCCSTYICKGCVYANAMANKHDEEKVLRCPFCREPAADDDEENDKRMMKRVKANDPIALCQMGLKYYGKGDYEGAFECWTKAAELGDSQGHYQLASLYHDGRGVEKNMKKEVHHLEKAAIGGHPFARRNLASIDEKNGNTERAVKHIIIAANLGDKLSMKELWKHYSAGNITKEDLDATLRTHHAAIDATKSEQRDAFPEAVFSNQ